MSWFAIPKNPPRSRQRSRDAGKNLHTPLIPEPPFRHEMSERTTTCQGPGADPQLFGRRSYRLPGPAPAPRQWRFSVGGGGGQNRLRQAQPWTWRVPGLSFFRRHTTCPRHPFIPDRAACPLPARAGVSARMCVHGSVHACTFISLTHSAAGRALATIPGEAALVLG